MQKRHLTQRGNSSDWSNSPNRSSDFHPCRGSGPIGECFRSLRHLPGHHRPPPSAAPSEDGGKRPGKIRQSARDHVQTTQKKPPSGSRRKNPSFPPARRRLRGPGSPPDRRNRSPRTPGIESRNLRRKLPGSRGPPPLGRPDSGNQFDPLPEEDRTRRTLPFPGTHDRPGGFRHHRCLAGGRTRNEPRPSEKRSGYETLSPGRKTTSPSCPGSFLFGRVLRQSRFDRFSQGPLFGPGGPGPSRASFIRLGRGGSGNRFNLRPLEDCRDRPDLGGRCSGSPDRQSSLPGRKRRVSRRERRCSGNGGASRSLPWRNRVCRNAFAHSDLPGIRIFGPAARTDRTLRHQPFRKRDSARHDPGSPVPISWRRRGRKFRTVRPASGWSPTSL